MAELPAWQPLERVDTASEGTLNGRVVAIVASQPAVEQGWAESAAVDLARAWSRAGRKVMLIDGALRRPGLHQAAGVPNGEGLSDVTLFGASVGRVARPVGDGGVFMITAGTAVADPGAVVRSPRWHRLARGFVEAGVTLALFLRDGEDDATAFLGSASEIVVLARHGDPPPGVVSDLEPLVRVVTGPTEPEQRDDPSGVLVERDTETADVGSASPSVTSVERRSANSPRLILLGVAALVLVVVLLAVLGVFTIPGITQVGSSTGPIEAPPLPTSKAG